MENPHKELFKNGNREWKYIPKKQMFVQKKNEEKTDEQKALKVQGLLQKEREKRDRLKELEIDYKFPGYVCIFYNELTICYSKRLLMLLGIKNEIYP